jgi:hypothetical protein
MRLTNIPSPLVALLFACALLSQPPAGAQTAASAPATAPATQPAPDRTFVALATFQSYLRDVPRGNGRAYLYVDSFTINTVLQGNPQIATVSIKLLSPGPRPPLTKGATYRITLTLSDETLKQLKTTPNAIAIDFAELTAVEPAPSTQPTTRTHD